MTQENRELLFKSLSEGQYFNVVVQNVRPGMEHIKGRLLTMSFYQPASVYVLTDPASGNQEFSPAEDIRPYLRPLSSMTEEEKWEEQNTVMKFLQDFYNERHLDYRGLIEKGLAVAVTEKNNPYK